MKGGQYPDDKDERTGDALRIELEVLRNKLQVARPEELKGIQRQMREIQFELTRRIQFGDNR